MSFTGMPENAGGKIYEGEMNAVTHRSNSRLVLVKTVHTVIWVFYNVVIFYMLYAVIVNRIDKWLWICFGLVLLEGIILLVFKQVCPVTLIARKYSDSDKSNFDIYLPEWLARYNKLIYTIIVLVIVVILLFRII
jgi:hypothetical protein